MVIEYTMHLIWDIFFLQNLTEAIYILCFTIHLHQRNAEIITNIRNLKQQVGICNNVDTLHILGHRAPILTTHIVNKNRIMYIGNTMAVFGRIFVLVFQALDAIHDIGVIIKTAKGLIGVFGLTLQKGRASEHGADPVDGPLQRMMGDKQENMRKKIMVSFGAR